jgi:putative Mg2+ transporter-C (MgtC) family protein
VLIALQIVGAVELKLGWKRYSMVYEVRADVGAVLPSAVVGEQRAEALAEDVVSAQHRMLRAILRVLDSLGQRLAVLDRDNVAGIERVSFAVVTTRREHAWLLKELRDSDMTDQVVAFQDQEDD